MKLAHNRKPQYKHLKINHQTQPHQILLIHSQIQSLEKVYHQLLYLHL